MISETVELSKDFRITLSKKMISEMGLKKGDAWLLFHDDETILLKRIDGEELRRDLKAFS